MKTRKHSITIKELRKHSRKMRNDPIVKFFRDLTRWAKKHNCLNG